MLVGAYYYPTHKLFAIITFSIIMIISIIIIIANMRQEYKDAIVKLTKE
jgi:hypothetical protein